MAGKIPPAGPLTGTEKAIIIQGGHAVSTDVQSIADRGPTKAGPAGPKGDPGQSITGPKGDKGDAGAPKRIERFTGTTNSSGIAAITFDPAFSAVPDVDVIEGWSGDQMVTGAVVAGSITKTGCQVQVMISRGTLVLTSGPFQKASAGVSITVRAFGN